MPEQEQQQAQAQAQAQEQPESRRRVHMDIAKYAMNAEVIAVLGDIVTHWKDSRLLDEVDQRFYNKLFHAIHLNSTITIRYDASFDASSGADDEDEDGLFWYYYSK